ncbi:MAG: hypothetical protein ACE5K4_06800 [Candidatus Hydrothermarchaeota archaeon]
MEPKCHECGREIRPGYSFPMIIDNEYRNFCQDCFERKRVKKW